MPYTIQQQPKVLLVVIQAPLTNGEFATLRDAVASHVTEGQSVGVVVDVSALDVIDSLAVRTLHDVARLSRLGGAETVVAGIRPDVAFVLDKLGVTLPDVAIVRDLHDAIAYLERTIREER